MSDNLEKQLYLERYIADRTHELEMDKLSGELERTFVQVAGVLNGASATVFISFLGSTVDKVKTNPFLMTAAFVAWLIGLGVSILAGTNAYRAQQHFSTQYRARRHEAGLRLFESEYRKASGVLDKDDADHFARRAENENSLAEDSWKRARRFGVAGILLFGLGAVLALVTVLMATPLKLPGQG